MVMLVKRGCVLCVHSGSYTSHAETDTILPSEASKATDELMADLEKLEGLGATENAPPVSSPVEEEKVEERLAIGPHIVYETIRREGEQELERTSSALAWSGFAAGLSMGFSLIAEALLSAYLPEAHWSPLIYKFGYCLGFLIVTLGRQQLFTETTLTVILPFLLRSRVRVLVTVLRVWGVILVANLVGTYLFALCIARIPLFNPHIQQVLLQVSQERSAGSIGITFVRAIFAGWLIALMVWLMPAADNARVSIIIIITYLIGLAGFNHIIAGSTKMFFLVASGAESWGAYIVHFFVPTLAGNIVGGVSLVAFLGHAQVVSGKTGE